MPKPTQNGNYHIYIHQTKEVIHKHTTAQKASNGSGSGNTIPRSVYNNDRQNKVHIPSQVPGASIANNIISMSTEGASVGGVIGVVIAVAKATEQAQKAVAKLAEETASASGDYTWSTWWNNMATTQHNIMHPISSYISAQQMQASWARADRATDEQRTLLGDTAINTLTKGV